ncbi:Indolepyruvate oxidoreductase subunit IorB II [Pseudonocardia sp. Ae406_Ps2]|uniref:indolepyruvate oxidoreductase subunit beta family protein n=1 Tax=unclassified Pseudonocardia TaxID=2619320 RepID=UPI00095BE894|nr:MULTISPECIES: indolepyruvate oxidoreductase subunit beta family protein [unclassified Pseudonocardia]OLM02034.1 Indolepyruvate oxidoreductase subunit IorB II [Pseudonocardia sp. Ae406_Ps2]OLM06182.1 Indolepyruvate oxidoreductase subunit IorB II [Pseudonocardia sp. Ae331_Ps2]OLM12918.1 Indolepyruvate oxidoreductase subunit IorB II [Pseudonocardia sp. Ae505_Ps2]OLM23609.1 Indolepyruvate oxidoreductase subunit IorB II [Pseudonocardia sp. Ae706_Ps2]OLM32648.1 Indolepyruvate oxidoreductase subun
MPTVMPAPTRTGTASWYAGNRPITLAILAMGGEGGGVLADWVVAVAEAAGYHAQTTSVAGVAQRTGATVYYAELHPPLPESDSADGAGRAEPVLSVFPTPGEVDVVVASELMECGRAVQRGFATPDRTTLITSTNRVYSIDEKMHLGDGRVDSDELVAAAGRAARHLVAADFAAIAEEHRSVISAALFGALAGSGALPFSRDRFEQAIRDAGKGVEPSLAAFAGGFDAATAALAPAPPAPRAPATVDIAIGPRPVSAEERKEREEARRNDIAATDPESLVGEDLRPLARTVADLPAAARSTVLHGLVRTGVYQDLDYAARYLERVRAFAAVDPDRAGAARLTTEAARHLALWMCYQDTIHVALQKTRKRRLERVREEARVTSAQLSQVREYLHPQAEEITDTLPYRLGKVLRRSRAFTRTVDRVTREGMVLDTTSVTGYAMLATMARMRPLRPRSLRFVEEQKAIEAWTALALGIAAEDTDLATEVVVCQKVLKGYGATYAHGNDSFALLCRAAGELRGRADAAAVLARLRSAALADEDGAALREQLSGAGLPTTVPSKKGKH